MGHGKETNHRIASERSTARGWWPAVIGAGLLLGACGSSGGDTASATTAAGEATVPTTTVAPTTTTVSPETTVPVPAALELAEDFVTALYSFDAEALESLPWGATVDLTYVSYYQAWAEGAETETIATTCAGSSAAVATCEVTKVDAINTALGLEPVETWNIAVDGGVITGLDVADAPPAPSFIAYFEFVGSQHPEIVEGVCLDSFNGGPTPFECGQANIALVAEFLESEFYTAP